MSVFIASTLRALEKHIPSAKLLLQECAPLQCPVKEIDIPPECEVLCVYGVSAGVYAQAREWLDELASRRLVFIEENGRALASLVEDDDAILLLNDLRVKLYFLESPLQVEPVAKKVAWQAVFRELSFVPIREGDYSASFQKELEKGHLGAHLLLSESADWGGSLWANVKANSKRSRYRSGLGLKGKFRGIPALVVGAGPSLEKNGSLLQQFENRALILAGGSALNALDCEPHLAASIDKEAPYRQFKRHPFFETPFCFQSRMNRENFSLVHGEALLFPDGSSEWVNWLNDQQIGFETGWTVGNFLTGLAFFLGCNPIVLVGMDLCYKDERKYSRIDAVGGENLIEAYDGQGKKVLTQRDWIMAARWTSEWAAKHRAVQIVNATEGGLGFASPVGAEPLLEILSRLPEIPNLRERLHGEIQTLPIHRKFAERQKEWEESLIRCHALCEEIENFDWEMFEREIVFQKLLEPLWQIWKPVFEREMDLDLEPLARWSGKWN